MKPQYESMLELAATVAYAAGADALPYDIMTQDIPKNVAKLGKLASSIRYRRHFGKTVNPEYEVRTAQLETKAHEIANALAVSLEQRGSDLVVKLGNYETTLS